jgi:hypothetical protein
MSAKINPKTVDPASLPSLPLRDRRKLPNCPAIYFVLEGDAVIYIGQATSLVLRWQNHDKFKSIKLRTRIRLAWLECSDISLLKGIESALIKAFQPELNKTGIPKVKPAKTPRSVVKSPRAMKRYHFDDQGNFKSPNPEPLAKRVIGVRLPMSVDARVRQLAGDELAEWVRQAIAEKLARESCQQESA